MKLAFAPLFIAIAAALLLAIAGPGTRLELWEFGTGFLMMRWALFLGLGGSALALLLLAVPKIRRGRSATLAIALAIGLATAWVPWSGFQAARSLPMIHDITTDTADPPQFVDVVPLRANAPNPVDYPGDEVASQQSVAYPDIQPLDLSLAADLAFERALQTARELGWEIVSAEPAAGRIEATATTFWFGFKDDVVIRIAPAGGGSRLDIRSKSRVGRSDVGANAERIRNFINNFKQTSET
jgi:uncharacterized protein (DUF1499 family)